MKKESVLAVDLKARKKGRRSLPAPSNVPVYIYPILSFLLVFFIWTLAVVLFRIPAYLVPTPLDVLKEITTQYSLLSQHLWPTLLEIIVGYILAVLVAVPLAILIAWSHWMDKIINPILVAIHVTPTVAIAPLFVVWFGYGILPKILTVFLISFFPILVNAISGLRSTEQELIYLMKSMGASSSQIFLKVRIQQALPQIFTGMKISITVAVVGSIVAEFVGSDAGLGYLLQMANGQLNTLLIFADLVTLCVLGIFLYKWMEWMERKTIPWHVSFRDK